MRGLLAEFVGTALMLIFALTRTGRGAAAPAAVGAYIGAVEAMREAGIDITGQQPKILEYEIAQDSDIIITMGCGDTCPTFPGKRYEDWKLDDPAGQPLEVVRGIRDTIRNHVEELLTELAANY